MADLSNDIRSGISTGAVNRTQSAFGPTASEIYRSGADTSIPPIDAVALSMKRTTTINSMQFPGDRPKFYVKIDIMDYHRFDGGGGSMFQISRTDIRDSIILPLPQMLTDANQVSYDQIELGPLIGGGGQILGNSINNTGAAGSGLTQSAAIGGAAAGSAALGAIDSLVSNRTRGAVPRGLITQAGTNVARLAGYTPNQFLTILLKGPAYKRHSLRWLVSPHNQQEALNLQQIIMTINNAKAPGTTAGGAVFTFPSVFNVSIMPNSRFMYKFKPAVVESFTVDYTGGTGIPNFKRPSSQYAPDSAPALLQIEMNLLELEFWLKGNYTDSNDPLDVSVRT